MKILQGLRQNIRLAIGALGVAAVGGALAAVAATPKGKDLRERAIRGFDAALAALRSRFDREVSVDVAVEPIDAKVEQEHAREHGAEGREWASAHAKKPHVLPGLSGEAARNVVMRRAIRQY